MPGIDETVIGAGAPLSRAEQLNAQLQQLAGAHAQATEHGKMKDAALIDVDHQSLFAEWCVAQQVEVARQMAQLKKDKLSLLLRLAWWHHLEGLTDEPQEVSPVQCQIFKDEDIQPRSWAHARNALEMMEEYRRPSNGSVASWTESGQQINAQAGRLEKCLTEFHTQLDVHDRADASWEIYHKEKESALRMAFEDYDYQWKLSGFKL